MSTIRRLHVYLIILAALIIHLTILNHVKIFGAKPDLILAMVVFFGLFLGPGRGLESGIVAGALVDICALDFFGINTLILGLVGLLAGSINTKFFKESKRTEILLVCFFTILAMSLHYILVAILSKSLAMNFLEFLFSSIIPTAIYTALLSIPVYLKLIDFYNLKEEESFL